VQEKNRKHPPLSDLLIQTINSRFERGLPTQLFHAASFKRARTPSVFCENERFIQIIDKKWKIKRDRILLIALNLISFLVSRVMACFSQAIGSKRQQTWRKSHGKIRTETVYQLFLAEMMKGFCKDCSFHGWCDSKTPVIDSNQNTLRFLFSRLAEDWCWMSSWKDRRTIRMISQMISEQDWRTRKLRWPAGNTISSPWRDGSSHALWVRESDCQNQCCRDATSASSLWLTESEPVWLLGIWNVEAKNNGPTSTKRWRNSAHDANLWEAITLHDDHGIVAEWIEGLIWVGENSGE
jgi:hypothetical protein